MTQPNIPSWLLERGPTFVAMPGDKQRLITLQSRLGSMVECNVFFVNGLLCETKYGMLTTWAASLNFPSYFGGNWDAFFECFSELIESEPARFCVILVSDAHIMLSQSSVDFDAFVDVVRIAVREELQTPRKELSNGRDCKVVLQYAPSDHSSMMVRLQNAGVENIPLIS